jgi:hypothetical protein
MKKATELSPATLIQKKAASVGSCNLNGRSPLASSANEAIGAGAARIRHPLDVTARLLSGHCVLGPKMVN